jgi:hypothetical protein
MSRIENYGEMSKGEILGDLDRLSKQLKDKEPKKEQAELALMKLRYEIKELRHKQTAHKKRLKELRQQEPPRKHKK